MRPSPRSTPPAVVLSRAGVGAAGLALATAVVLSLVAPECVFIEAVTSVRGWLAILSSLTFVLAALAATIASALALVLSARIRPPALALGAIVVAIGIAASGCPAVQVDLMAAALAACAWLGLSLRAHRRIVAERELDATRRRAQLALTWALPYVGPMIVLAFYGALDRPRRSDGFTAAPGNMTDWLG